VDHRHLLFLCVWQGKEPSGLMLELLRKGVIDAVMCQVKEPYVACGMTQLFKKNIAFSGRVIVRQIENGQCRQAHCYLQSAGGKGHFYE
jgi:hypothetical protein